jgi:3-hydroxy acid dehydrogenase/malonic semialdehyde reductase
MYKSDLSGKICLITGASSGIGYESAIAFAKAKLRLILCARREERLNELANKLRKEYQAEVITLVLDVAKSNEVVEKLKSLPTDWQEIDILLNNAGMARTKDTLHEGNPADWDEMIDTNIKGVLSVSRMIIPGMMERQKGHVINIGSVSGEEVYPGGGVYCATKHALRAITKGFRMELLGKNIRVTSINPGAVETEFSLVRYRGDTEKAAAVYQGMTPLSPKDIADAVLYAATCPAHVNIAEIKIMPTDQASVGMTHRKKE